MKFTLHHHRARSFQDAVLSLAHRRKDTSEEFWALRDVSFDVQPGECLGIIGQNGSGKSTILKLITRILDPSSGKVTVNGKISALIELGAGFHPDLTGRENIYLNGSIMGFGRKEMDRRFDSIVAYSELERFIDTPVKHYSSGMYVRLAFSVAISVEPDILIIDEVLAVGDESFQRKCLERIDEFRRQGKTIVVVSHGLELVERLCDQVVWLHGGVVRGQGDAVAIIHAYVEAMRRGDEDRRAAEQRAVAETEESHLASRMITTNPNAVEIVDVRILSEARQEKHSFRAGDAVLLRVRYRAGEAVTFLQYGLELRRSDGLLIHQSSRILPRLGRPYADRSLVAELTVPALPLLSGTYDLVPVIRDPEDPSSLARETAGCRISVWSDPEQRGLVPVTLDWQAEKERSGDLVAQHAFPAK